MITFRNCLATVLLTGLPLALTACEGLSTLAQQQKIDRANIPLERIDTAPVARPPVTQAPPAAATPIEGGQPALPAPTQAAEQGSYVFTIPPTITSVKQSNAGMQQYRLYVGQPTPQATPFMVMTVAPEQDAPTQEALGEPAYRSFRLNGLTTQEWKGYDTQHHPYCELLVSRGESGDQLHAIAVARNNQERALALQILNTIKWKAAEQP
jgi:hypothetical protein